MKLKRFILLFAVFFFMSTVSVNAASVRHTCDYNYRDQVSGHSSSSTISFYTDNSTPKMAIKSFNNHHLRNYQYKINNWNDIKSTFSNNNDCPQYALIYHFVGKNNATTVEVYLSNDKSYLNGKIKNWWGNDSYHIATSFTNGASSEEAENYYRSVVNHTNHINTTYQNYSMQQCKDSSKVITRIAECKKIYDGLENYMASSEKEVNSWIQMRYISSDDARTKAFFEALQNARNKWSSVKSELDQEQAKIDEEMGIKDPNSEPGKSEGDNSSKNEGNSNVGNNDNNIQDVTVGSLCTSNNLKKPLKYIGWLLTAAKIIVPILIIAMGALDFFKVVTSAKGDEVNKALKSLAMRVITGIVLFFIPALIHFIFSLVDDWSNYNTHYSECTKCLYHPKSC